MSIVQQQAILCIDDEKIILDSLKAQLKEELDPSFKVEVAESAEEGYEIIDELVESGVSVLLIVSDWLMPQIKGDEFLAEVHKKHPKIVKIMLTGHADKDAVQRAFDEADLYKVISKPWSKEELIEAVNKGLEKVKG